MKYFQLFRKTGLAGQVNYAAPIKSSETEKKKLIAVHIELEEYANTDDNEIQGWHERAMIFEFPEKLFNTELAAITAPANVRAKMGVIPVDLEIPVGEEFKVAIKCGDTGNSIRGVYEYEIVA